MGNILDAKAFFRANVSDELLATIVKKIQGGTRDAASRICGDVREGIYTKRVARDLFPYVRRGTIETRLFDLARIHRWTGMDGVRTAEGGEEVTGAMIRARIRVDGR